MKRAIFWMLMSVFWLFSSALWMFYDISKGKWVWAGLWFASALLNAVALALWLVEARRINEAKS